MENCAWCGCGDTHEGEETVYWELPDGTKAIEITKTPTIKCSGCQMQYQTEIVVKEIEDQLFLIDTKKLGKQISFASLLQQPRLLKRNYFDFSS